MQRIDGVAGQERVAQDRVVEIGLVIEGHAFRQTSLQVDHRVHRRFHRQLQCEEIRDHACRVKDRIVVDTAGGFLQVVITPDERLRVSRRVELAQRQEIAPLLNEVEEIYPVALVRVAGKNGIRRETELVYLFLMPYIRQRLIVIQDLRLVMQRHALLHDLDQDHAVAHIICHTGTIERVTIYYSRQVVSVIIIDTVDTHALAFTELIAIYAFRYFVDRQVQTIDAVRAIYRGIAVFVLVGGADSVLQRVCLMLYRTFQPEERQIRLAYRRVLLKQVRRIDDQHQLLAVIATAFRRSGVVVCSRSRDERVRAAVYQPEMPPVRQLGIGYLYRVAQIQRGVEMHIYLYDTVATVNGMQVRDNYGVLVVILCLIADECTRTAGVQMPDDGICIILADGKMEREDRIYFASSGLKDRIDIRAAGHVFVAAPFVEITFAYRLMGRV